MSITKLSEEELNETISGLNKLLRKLRFTQKHNQVFKVADSNLALTEIMHLKTAISLLKKMATEQNK